MSVRIGYGGANMGKGNLMRRFHLKSLRAQGQTNGDIAKNMQCNGPHASSYAANHCPIEVRGTTCLLPKIEEDEGPRLPGCQLLKQ